MTLRRVLFWCALWCALHVGAVAMQNTEIPVNQDANPALWTAARDGGTEVVRQLLADGAEVEERGGWTEGTALDVAATHGHEAVARLLIGKGAAVSAKDNGGITPLHWAASRGHEAVVWLLLEHRAEVSVKDDHGVTPLHSAASYGFEAVVGLLLEHGADLSAKLNKRGWTPLDLAIMRSEHSVAAMLSAEAARRAQRKPSQVANLPPGRCSICPCREANSPLPAQKWPIYNP